MGKTYLIEVERTQVTEVDVSEEDLDGQLPEEFARDYVNQFYSGADWETVDLDAYIIHTVETGEEEETKARPYDIPLEGLNA
jgi:hypothetical protein